MHSRQQAQKILRLIWTPDSDADSTASSDSEHSRLAYLGEGPCSYAPPIFSFCWNGPLSCLGAVRQLGLGLGQKLKHVTAAPSFAAVGGTTVCQSPTRYTGAYTGAYNQC